MEHVILREKVYHKVGTGFLSLTIFTLLIWNIKWLLSRTRSMRCSQSYPFVAKCCGSAQDSLFFELDIGECRTPRVLAGVHPDDALAPSSFCMLVDPRLREMHECYNSLGFDIFTDVNGIFAF